MEECREELRSTWVAMDQLISLTELEEEPMGLGLGLPGFVLVSERLWVA
jgi:hypothetical protein